jgi:hypothetical protein
VDVNSLRVPPPPSQAAGDGEQLRSSQSSNASEDLPGSSGTSAKKHKKCNTLVILTEQEEEKMVTFLQTNSCFYNKKTKAYKFGNDKKALWAQQAKSLGYSTVQLTTWYRTIRSTYGRLTSPHAVKSGSAAKDLTDWEKWVLSNFAFLKDHIVRVPSRQACNVSL